MASPATLALRTPKHPVVTTEANPPLALQCLVIFRNGEERLLPHVHYSWRAARHAAERAMADPFVYGVEYLDA